jgi:hypothetical protein
VTSFDVEFLQSSSSTSFLLLFSFFFLFALTLSLDQQSSRDLSSLSMVEDDARTYREQNLSGRVFWIFSYKFFFFLHLNLCRWNRHSNSVERSIGGLLSNRSRKFSDFSRFSELSIDNRSRLFAIVQRLSLWSTRRSAICLIQLSDEGHVLTTLRARQASALSRIRVAGRRIDSFTCEGHSSVDRLSLPHWSSRTRSAVILRSFKLDSWAGSHRWREEVGSVREEVLWLETLWASGGSLQRPCSGAADCRKQSAEAMRFAWFSCLMRATFWPL